MDGRGLEPHCVDMSSETRTRRPAVGEFYDIIQRHIDAQPYGVSDRKIAKELGVTQTTLSNWRTPKKLIDKRHVIAVSKLTGVPYERVRDALLYDIGWMREGDPTPPVEPRRQSG